MLAIPDRPVPHTRSTGESEAMTAEQARAVLVDDVQERRVRLMEWLRAAGVAVVAEVPLGVSAAPAVASAQPEYVFIAFEEPLPRAMKAVEVLAATVPKAVIVGYSGEATNAAYQQALRAGARYLLDEPASLAEVCNILAVIQAHAPRHIRPSGTVVTVAGPKGGIGKTTVSVNLASTLAKEHHGSVLLIDLDPDFGDAGLLLDINTNYSTARAARDQSRFEFDSFRRILSIHESGAYLLGAPQRFSERVATNPSDLEALLQFAAQSFDFVLVDTPCTLDDLVVTAFNAADLTLLTTTLEFGSLRNAALLQANMAYEGAPRERTLVLANHTDPVAAFSAGDAAEVLGREKIWEVPYDPAMPRSTQEGRPLTLLRPRSAASLSLRALASRLGEPPDQIDRRLAVRERGLASAEVRERLFRVVGAARPIPIERFIFGTSRKSTTYHTAGCSNAQRLTDYVVAGSAELPGHLRPCRVCLPTSAAA